MARSDAHVRSRQAVGSPLLARESARVWVSRRIDEALQDLRYGWRGLQRTPGVTFVAVLMLAFGIGANTAIFSVATALLLRPMPVVEPDRLIRISEGQGAVLSFPIFREVSSGTLALRAVAATLPMQSGLDVDGDSHFAAAEFVTANYADVLGVRVSFGRGSWTTASRPR
jgi:putative ABC transport system permease protein